MWTDTVAAISTAPGTGGVGIIRISGADAKRIAGAVFDGKEISKMENRKMYFGNFIADGCIMDQGLICLFDGPNSYTGEDVAELYCHGGAAICRLLLDAVIRAGANLAGPGEFTRRAFLNGRLDLAQAEAVADLIDAQTESEVFAGAKGLEGRISAKTESIRQEIVAAAAHILAILDYPDEGVEDLPIDELCQRLNNALADIDALLATKEDGRIVKDGVDVAIAGSPNVGKSSLLNAICGEDRAIVTDIAGTTRDVVECQVNIRGCKVNLYDTAGIRQSNDKVEQLGVERSRLEMDNADLILLVLDGSREINDEDMAVINMVQGRENVLLVQNKSDLPQKAVVDGFANRFSVCAKTGEGLDGLFAWIGERFARGELVKGKAVLTNKRQIIALEHAKAGLQQALDALAGGATEDLILEELEVAADELGKISGRVVSDDIIDGIFSTFCVGK